VLAYAVRELDAAQMRHMDVDQRHIGFAAPDQSKSLLPIRRFTDNFDAGLLRKNHAKAGPHEFVIVYQNNTDHAQPVLD
jgi:hypothetical protein